ERERERCRERCAQGKKKERARDRETERERENARMTDTTRNERHVPERHTLQRSTSASYHFQPRLRSLLPSPFLLSLSHLLPSLSLSFSLSLSLSLSLPILQTPPHSLPPQI